MMKLLIFNFVLMLNIFYINKKILYLYNFLMLLLLNFMYMNSLNYSNSWMSIYSWMGLDFISMSLVILTLWILSMMFLVSNNMKFIKNYSFILLSLLMVLVVSFSSMNYFMFYIFFEISLIPTFLLIIGWGYQPERINASMYMILYTLFASLPKLILMFYLFDYFFSLNYLIILNKSILNLIWFDFILYFYMIFAFLMKLPLYLFHMWLPKAHIEAPVTGSMILAGVMLKLGGYGIMRSMMMMMNLCKKFNYIIFMISLIGMVYLSLLCLRIMDIKLIVAYSSVVHMGLMVMGFMSMMYWGYLGGLLMMLSHGLCSSGMFMMVNYFYMNLKTRNILMNKGFMNLMPSMMLWWFMLCIANMSAPITLNLLSELMIINVLLNWSLSIIIFLMIGMYLSASYSLYLFSYISHGKLSNILLKFDSINMMKFISVLMHWVPLNFIIMKMDMIF